MNFLKWQKNVDRYNGSSNEYTLKNSGICFIACPPCYNGFNSYIGLVALEYCSVDGLVFQYYASIRFSQAVMLPALPPFQLEGFITSTYSYLPWVSRGLYRFGSDVKPDGKTIRFTTSLSTKDDGNEKQQISFVSGKMDYLPTGSIQKIMDSFKDEIKKKCGITGDLDTFQVVSATAYSPVE